MGFAVGLTVGLVSAQDAVRLNAGEAYEVCCGSCGLPAGVIKMGGMNSFGDYEDDPGLSDHTFPDISATLTAEGTDEAYFIGTQAKKIVFFDDGTWKLYDNATGDTVGTGTYSIAT